VNWPEKPGTPAKNIILDLFKTFVLLPLIDIETPILMFGFVSLAVKSKSLTRVFARAGEVSGQRDHKQTWAVVD
jgi:hypothetical protein